MSTLADRVIALRTERKWHQKDLAEAVKRAGFPITQQGIDRIEKRNTARPRCLPELAKALDVSEHWLLTGRGERSRRKSEPPVVGYVGAGEQVFPIDDHALGDGIDTTEQPPGETGTVVAVTVRGDSMEPIYRAGDLLFYAEDRRDPAGLIGLDCIVKVQDGPVYVKTLRRHQKRGQFILKSYNGEDIGPVQIEFAHPVKWVRRKA